MAMRMEGVHSSRRWAAALLLALACGAMPLLAAEDEAAQRRRALALNDITGNEPIEGEIRILAKDPKGTKQLLAVAQAMAKEKDQPFNYNAALILAGAADELQELDAGRTFYRLCAALATKLQSGQKLAQAYLGLISMLYENKMYEESAKVCQEFLELPDEDADPMRRGPVTRMKSAVQRQMILAIAKQGKHDEAHKMLDRLQKAQPENWLLLPVRAEVFREGGREADAAKTYEELLERISKEKALEEEERALLTERYRYLLSGLYVDLSQIDKAADHLKALLAKEPDNPTFNNDLGYIWADHGQNLDEAEKLIRKALDEDRKQRKASADLPPEEDKDNAAFVDSLGWVLYKKKDYQGAKKYLLQAAADKDGQHIEILDHLADTHLALGEKAEAVAVWKKALELPVRTKREQLRKVEVEKKLKAHE
jgi:tetratricopeptide (TPR) repeat protein